MKNRMHGLNKIKLGLLAAAVAIGAMLFGQDVEASVADDVAARTYTRTVEVTQASIDKYGFTNAFYRTIEQANSAHSLESEKGLVKVTMPAATYEIANPIQVNYSNLTVDFTGCTFVQPANNVGNLLRIGESSNKRTGYYYHDITIIGGTFDGNGSSSTLFKTAHARDITVVGAVFRNVKNGHLTEAAGVDGLILYGCTFEDQMLATSGATLTYEAVQLDILSHEHFSGYMAEALATRNVLVEKCVFDNVPRGIGSHTSILNCPLDGITVKNNTFQNIGSIAVQGHNWINATISGNKISGCPRGIALYVLQATGTYTPSDIAMEDGVETTLSDRYIKPAADQRIVISGNQITCGGKDRFASYAPVGIYVGGLKLTKNTKMTKGSTIPKGDYYISGVTIKNNKVRSVGNGIRLEDVRKAKIVSNTLRYAGKAGKDSYHGILLRLASQADQIKNNKVSGYNGYGISVVTKSKVTKMSGNKVSGCAGKVHISKDSRA